MADKQGQQAQIQTPPQPKEKRRWISENVGFCIFEPIEESIEPNTGRVQGYTRPGSDAIIREIDIKKLRFHPGFVAWAHGLDYEAKEVGIFETDNPVEIALLEAEAERVAGGIDRMSCVEYSRAREAMVRQTGKMIKAPEVVGASIQE